MEIRQLNIPDLAQFKAIRIAAVEEFPTSFYPSRQELTDTPDDEFLAQIAPSEWSAVFAAFDDSELIGIIGMKRDRREKVRHKAEVWGLYVKPSRRGNGVARQLVHAGVDHAKLFPEVSVITLSVSSMNDVARALYISCGFELFGTEKNAMRVDGKFIDEEHMRLDLISTNRESQ